MNETWYRIICVIIMCLVTYIPRALPITFFTRRIESKFIKSFLYYVPYAVLSSLTFPAIFYCIDNIYIALIGTGVAILLSLFNQKMYIVALASILIVFGLGFIF